MIAVILSDIPNQQKFAANWLDSDNIDYYIRI